MTSARCKTRPIAAIALACMLAACKGGCSSASAGGADGGHGDGAIDDRAAALAALHDGGAATALDAAPPSDELIPPTSSDELTQRGRHLLEAVAKDDPDLAVDIVFPRDAWLATRDAVDGGKDWDKHVDGPFRRSVHALARRRGGLQDARFVSLELGHAVIQATPRRHGFKKPLWTVHGSRLTYTIDGHTRVLSVREMTAWRGAWYVTRLR